MDLLALNSHSGSSPFAAQLKAGYSDLSFRGFLEKDFREVFVQQNFVRGRIAAAILFTVAIAVTLLEWAVSEPTVIDPTRAARFGLIIPSLALLMAATYVPSLQRHYTWIASVSITLLGLVVVYKSQAAAINGEFYPTIGLSLVILFACLFPGLVFRVSTSIGTALMAAYFVLGLNLGAPLEPLSYATAMLLATVMISALASYNLEFVLRTSFLETRLLNELAERDGLTGLYNRRMFDDFIRRIWRQSQREDVPLQIILVDIDHFKIFNDLYGHQAGDDCLKKVAACIARSAKRPFDFAARYGGEEFVLVLYGPPHEHARMLPEQIRLDVMDLGIPHDGSGIDTVVTVSVGVALASPGAGRSLTGTIQIADEALYEAKRAGRNRLVCRDAEEYEVETGNFRVVSEGAG